MAATQMVNFRMTQTELDQIDYQAKLAGQTRSDWIRDRLRSAVVTHKATPTSTLKPADKIKTGECSHVNTVMLPTRVKMCQDCGNKIA